MQAERGTVHEMILIERARHAVACPYWQMGVSRSDSYVLDLPRSLYLHSYVARCKGEGLQSRIVRFLSGCLVFLAIAAAAPQDSFDLRSRYGEPDVERFEIRPGITMTVGYGTDGKACMLEIEPRTHFLQGTASSELLSHDTMTNILDEVAPPSMRGKVVNPGLFGVSGGCADQYTFTEYDNIETIVNSAYCENSKGVHAAIVHFKRGACGQWYTPPIVKLR